jgi:hypothetical protein
LINQCILSFPWESFFQEIAYFDKFFFKYSKMFFINNFFEFALEFSFLFLFLNSNNCQFFEIISNSAQINSWTKINLFLTSDVL